MNPLLWLIVWLPVLMIVALASRRLLGVRRLSATKTVLAAVIGLLAGWLIALAAERRGGADDEVIVTGVVLSILFTMAAILVLELLSRPGAGPHRPHVSRPRPIKAIRDNVAAARRGAEVSRIAVRHGLGPLLGIGGGRRDLIEDPAELGRRMRAALEEAGGLFVKLGQLLATRDDLIPPETARELTGLQQGVSAESRDVVQGVLERELGAATDEVFSEFQWDPIGAASIGQVYEARLQSGEAVVVKVRRTGIVASVERDLQIVTRMAAGVERRTSWGAEYGVSAIAEEFAANLRQELDFTIEVRNMGEVASALATVPDIRVPLAEKELCSEQVVVMEKLAGEPLGRAGSVAALGLDGRRLANALFHAELESMVNGETFHADPHPGNVMILPDGRLGLIDFGSAARLDAFEQAAVSDILTALYLQDPTLLREAAIGVASVRSTTDPIQLERAFARLMAQHLGPGAVPTEAMLKDFLAIVFRFGMTLPASVTAMFRALGTIAGTLEQLSPGYPLIDAAQEMASDRITTMFAPENAAEMTRKELIRLAPILQRAPRHLDRIGGQLARGELTTRVSLFSTPTDALLVSTLANRFILAFLGAALGLVSTLLLRTEGSIELFGGTTLLELLGYLGLVAGSVLVMRVVMDVLSSD